MRPDDINPRTGLVVALVSVFLVFGFMFTVSGIKGETLGDIPLLAIGPAICLPGIAAIALTRKTDGCTKWPQHRCCPPCSCCASSSCTCCCCCRERKGARDKDALELLRTPSDLESGKGSCGELAAAKAALPTGCAAITTIAASSSSFAEDHQVIKEGKVLLGYLEKCSPEMPGNVLVVEEEEEEEEANPSYIRAFLETPPAQSTTVITPSDTIIVCSYKETSSSSPYDRYCCYVNPSQDQEEEEVCSDHDDDDDV